jgi:hypothetical protein
LEEGLRLLVRSGPLTALALLPFAVILAIDGLGWRRLFAPPTRARVSLGSAFAARAAGEAVGQSLPSAGIAGEAAAAWLLRVRTATPLGESIGTLTARRFLLALGHGLTLALAAGVLALAPPSAPRDLVWLLAVAAAATLAVAVAGPKLLRRPAPFARLHVALRRVPWTGVRMWLEGPSARLPEADHATTRVFRRVDGPWIGAGALYFAMYLTEILETWFLLRLLGAEVPLTTVLVMEPLLSLLRAIVFFVPAGLGVQDLGYVAFLHAGGVPDAATLGAAFVLLKRLKELVWAAAGWSLLLVAAARSTGAAPPAAVKERSQSSRGAVTARL